MINILILFIYNETDEYKEMLNLQQLYVNTHKNIDSYFVTYRENQINKIEVENDIIYVKGQEGMLNILYKTLKAIEYLTTLKKYDYVIRTNISTFLHLNKIYNIFLNNVSRHNVYSGLNCFQLTGYRDKNAGLTDKSFNLYGIKECFFFQGTCIIFSIDVINYMLENQNKFIYNVIDDISIALFMRSFMNNVYLTGLTYKILNNEYIIRNKTDNFRENDIINIKKNVNTYLSSLN